MQQLRPLNIPYKHTVNLTEGSMGRLCLPLNEPSVSHLCLGHLFLSSGAGLRSLTTSYCQLDLFLRRVHFFLGQDSHLDVHSLALVQSSGWRFAMWGWLCGCSSQPPLSYTCVCRRSLSWEKYSKAKTIWVVREAVGYNNDELGSALTIAHTADWFIFALVWPPHFS